jgi:tRNA uridine 5-carboxymethylaminomethyl modification enzyme
MLEAINEAEHSLAGKLEVVECSVNDLIIEDSVCKGVRMSDGVEIRSDSVVLTTGTFLGGRCHIGQEKVEAGRLMRHDSDDQIPSDRLANLGTSSVAIEPASNALSKTIRRLGFPVGRLRTGTPPRIDGRTIDYSNLEPQASDDKINWFSFLNEFNGYEMQNKEIECHMTWTNEATHEIIRQNDHLTAKLSEDGSKYGNGPRYCPTIEKKLRVFPDKTEHNIWLEPEGLDSHVVYPNGISTGLPEDIQHEFIKTIPGLENAKIIQPAYCVGYDFVDPKIVLKHTLETKQLPGFFLAG